MMERSSRFISLSGLSGVSAGVCALVGACIAYPYVYNGKDFIINRETAIAQQLRGDSAIILNTWLFWIAVGTFFAALVSALIFTGLKSRKDGTEMWGITARRLMINVSIPILVGGTFLYALLISGNVAPIFFNVGFITPGCLIFYGLALINSSKYTLNEVRYLGYLQLLSGLINLCFPAYGLYFWAFGFGIMHIIYGLYMWNKYDRKTESD